MCLYIWPGWSVRLACLIKSTLLTPKELHLIRLGLLPLIMSWIWRRAWINWDFLCYVLAISLDILFSTMYQYNFIFLLNLYLKCMELNKIFMELKTICVKMNGIWLEIMEFVRNCIKFVWIEWKCYGIEVNLYELKVNVTVYNLISMEFNGFFYGI